MKIALFTSLYGFFAIAHIALQVFLGHLNYRRQSKEDKFVLSKLPLVAVFIPVYNENVEVFKNTLRGLQNLKDGSNLRFYIIDDGSTNGAALELAYTGFKGIDERFYFKRTENQGKRMAQYEGLNFMQDSGFKADVIVTIDSDTVIAPNGIKEIVKSLFIESNVAAVTGNVMVANKDKNLLTEMIGYRYWMAFNQERAAQSYFKVLMCCSGPFSAYRTSVFKEVMFEYINQWFLGKKCTYGDDRHLTNLILEHGYSAVYNYKAAAYTQVPEGIGQYIKQQIRWNKSFYREMLWTLKSINKHSWYLLYDLTMQFILPFMLIFAVVSVAIQSVNNWKILLAYISTVVMIGLMRVAYAMYRTKNVKFLKFLCYGLLHVFVLIPVRLYAIVTIRNGKWGTR